jgi:hypothetical protein
MTTKAICADCGAGTLAIGDFYMVKDDIWRRAWSIRRGNYEMPGQQFLCIGCLEHRLRYTLTRDGSIDALVNHPKNPSSSKRLLDRLVGFELSSSTQRKLPRWLREADKREADKREIDKREADKDEIAADTPRARELLRQAAAQRPCTECLRPASPCKERCLRALRLNPAEAAGRINRCSIEAEATAALKPKSAR